MSTTRVKIGYADGRTEERELSRGTYRIGRDAGDIVLGDPSVSSRHALLDVIDGRVVVTDLGSTNGTFDAAGQRLTAPYTLAPGQTLRLGGGGSTVGVVDETVARRAAPAGGTIPEPQAPPPAGPAYPPSAQAAPYPQAPAPAAPAYPPPAPNPYPGAPVASPGPYANPYPGAPVASPGPYANPYLGAPAPFPGAYYPGAPAASPGPYGGPGAPYPPPPPGPYVPGYGPSQPGAGPQPGYPYSPSPFSPGYGPRGVLVVRGVPIEIAPWGRRVVGFLIDSVLVAATALLLYGVLALVGLAGLAALAGGGARHIEGFDGLCCLSFTMYPLASLLVGGWNRAYLVSKRGFSIGQGFMKLKVVDARGNLLTLGNAVVRLLAQFGLSLIPLGALLDLFFPLWDPQRQTLHDKAVDAFVLENPSGESGAP